MKETEKWMFDPYLKELCERAVTGDNYGKGYIVNLEDGASIELRKLWDFISQLLSERTEALKEIKRTLDGESVYEKNGMSKLGIIKWIVETELDKLLKEKE